MDRDTAGTRQRYLCSPAIGLYKEKQGDKTSDTKRDFTVIAWPYPSAAKTSGDNQTGIQQLLRAMLSDKSNLREQDLEKEATKKYLHQDNESWGDIQDYWNSRFASEAGSTLPEGWTFQTVTAETLDVSFE